MISDARVFLDSNILIYLLSADARRADIAEVLLKGKPFISVQVLNEVTNVCVRKLKRQWEETNEFLAMVRMFCRVVPLTVDVHDKARQLAERYQMSFYDACIAASALAVDCQILYTEDMQADMSIDQRLTLINPFTQQRSRLAEPGF
ncbi:Predicted nucleic-acid-binding protein, contains PIN domain [Achromobacter spanius]|nr:tRNA(fMet)-specific endonuclease VapC [Achromobacter spanius]SPT38801.1 Predicted nucleic-acid-binding protein, contains PIN domain [Achromobacter denitrificans]VEE54946.1 Predicted nucleic-acid-binding protein, contains PIN domain [Achromobacter spanius]